MFHIRIRAFANAIDRKGLEIQFFPISKAKGSDSHANGALIISSNASKLTSITVIRCPLTFCDSDARVRASYQFFKRDPTSHFDHALHTTSLTYIYCSKTARRLGKWEDCVSWGITVLFIGLFLAGASRDFPSILLFTGEMKVEVWVDRSILSNFRLFSIWWEKGKSPEITIRIHVSSDRIS